MTNQIESDARLIESLGGASKLADLLGFEKQKGLQRVHNWATRGIPSHVKLKWPELFLRDSINRPDLPAPKTFTRSNGEVVTDQRKAGQGA